MRWKKTLSKKCMNLTCDCASSLTPLARQLWTEKWTPALCAKSVQSVTSHPFMAQIFKIGRPIVSRKGSLWDRILLYVYESQNATGKRKLLLEKPVATSVTSILHIRRPFTVRVAGAHRGCGCCLITRRAGWIRFGALEAL